MMLGVFFVWEDRMLVGYSVALEVLLWGWVGGDGLS